MIWKRKAASSWKTRTKPLNTTRQGGERDDKHNDYHQLSAAQFAASNAAGHSRNLRHCSYEVVLEQGLSGTAIPGKLLFNYHIEESIFRQRKVRPSPESRKRGPTGDGRLLSNQFNIFYFFINRKITRLAVIILQIRVLLRKPV